MANMSGKYTADCEAGQKKIEMMALERETTIAAIIHEWVQEHLGEGEK
ncbi:hypothetical protein ACTQZS_02400 [Bilifractor sp. LCP19S3_H10]